MDSAVRERLEAFVKPLYQDLDGASRFDEVSRVASIARRLYTPSDPEAHSSFELLLAFHGLGGWLSRVGNLTRAALGTGVPESDLRRTAAMLQRLDLPDCAPLIALASAIRIDGAGVRGLAARIAAARREGISITDVAREEGATPAVPEWMPAQARRWLEARSARRRQYCEDLLGEHSLQDLDETR